MDEMSPPNMNISHHSSDEEERKFDRHTGEEIFPQEHLSEKCHQCNGFK